MFTALESIGVKNGGPVAAGWLTHLYLISCQHVAYDVYPGSLLSPVHPLWLDGKLIQIKLRSKTASFSESLAYGVNGESYSCQISVPVVTLANDVTEWVYKNGKQRFVAFFRDTAGSCYLAGTKSNGLRLGWGRSVASVSSQQLLFSGVNWHPVLWLDSVDPALLFPSHEFDYSFDLSFS